jgi:hypothetical protein
MKQEKKSNPYFGVEISRSEYKNNRYDRDIELSISTNGHHWIGLPNMNIQDLKELRKSIRKYIKENKQ